MTIDITKAENGFVVEYEDRKWIAADVEDVRDVIEEILTEMVDDLE